MAIVVVGGSGKDIGKTALVCAVISALREFAWTAVKITGHDYAANSYEFDGPVIREETNAGEETDTSRYLAAGARRALLVTRAGADVPIEEIRRTLGSDLNVIFESNRIVHVLKPDLCLALLGGSEKKASFDHVFRQADAVVTIQHATAPDLTKPMRHFELERAGQLSAEMSGWLFNRLHDLQSKR